MRFERSVKVHSMLKEKQIVLGVTGGIAAYKSCELVRLLTKQRAEVRVILTEHGQRFVTGLTLQTLSGNKVHTDMFSEPDEWEIDHISLAQTADVLVVAPATANVIGKVASGVCDDLLTTTICATTAPVIFAPAMNTKMWENPIVQRNVKELGDLGYRFVPPGVGELACKDVGVGKMAEPAEILEYIRAELAEKSLGGRSVLISAGPTCEPIDPVRHITNRSSGKMGFALARAARRMGADVRLVTGPVALEDPPGVETSRVRTSDQMYDELAKHFPEADLLVMAAAVADVRPAKSEPGKLPKAKLPDAIKLDRTKDIVTELGGMRRPGQLIVGFAAETDDMEKRALGKLERKGLDLIVANDVSRKDIGFETDQNEVVIYSAKSDPVHVPLADKDDVAEAVLKEAAKLLPE